MRLAGENRDWGRIQVALSNLGHEIAESTIAAILKRHGLAPGAGAHPEDDVEGVPDTPLGGVSTDFFTVEIWTKRGLQRFTVL